MHKLCWKSVLFGATFHICENKSCFRKVQNNYIASNFNMQYCQCTLQCTSLWEVWIWNNLASDDILWHRCSMLLEIGADAWCWGCICFSVPGQQPSQAAYLADQHHGKGPLPTLPQSLKNTRESLVIRQRGDLRHGPTQHRRSGDLQQRRRVSAHK